MKSQLAPLIAFLSIDDEENCKMRGRKGQLTKIIVSN